MTIRNHFEENETYTTEISQVECPYCGAFNDLTESIEGRGDMLDSSTCSDCKGEFTVRVYTSTSVTAERKS